MNSPLGPGISYLHETDDGWTVTPNLRFDGVLHFTETPAASQTDLLGRLEARLDLTSPGGASFGFSAMADGIGTAMPTGYGGALRISVPLNWGLWIREAAGQSIDEKARNGLVGRAVCD